MKRVCVFCGSSSKADTVYFDAVLALAEEMGRREIGLVYGGGRGGVMGSLADAALDAGCEVVGVIPESIFENEEPHDSLTELHVTGTKDERKQEIVDRADGFIGLPGGIGTVEEIFDVLGRAKHGFHTKPCGVLNTNGYYDDLVSFFDNAADEGFLSPQQRSLLLVEDEPGAMFETFESYTAPV